MKKTANMKNQFLLPLSLLLALVVCIGYPSNTTAASVLYTPDWESLSNHNEAPEWFQDAKFGIYFTWGVDP